ncbi:hypothetical protein [Bradyrhizobium sp. sGM-13]|uniref:hypothetical protein n=1 Tax=Bradyrhizobium sp. sGM-13 TaxID=2831781 RepID=UPI001BD00A11
MWIRASASVVVELGSQAAVGVVVAPFAACRRADVDRTPHEFPAEFDELVDASLEDRELLGVFSRERPRRTKEGRLQPIFFSPFLNRGPLSA